MISNHVTFYTSFFFEGGWGIWENLISVEILILVILSTVSCSLLIHSEVCILHA